MPFTVDPGPEVDAEYVVPPEQQLPEVPYNPQVAPQPVQRLVPDPTRDVVDLRTDVSANPSLELALYERRGRAIAIFVELPILALVAVNDKTPGLIRLGAAMLAAWKAVELARGGAQEVETVVQEWRQQ